MTTEQLMQPRYKVIADYPKSVHIVGRVYELNDESHYLIEFPKYPHIFRKLEWWEERDVKDLPEYVKVKNNGAIRKVIEHNYLNLYNSCLIVENPEGSHKLFYEHLAPATIEEYNQYNNQ